MPRALKNFPYSTVLVAPSPATTGTVLAVQTGEGAGFPEIPFQAVICPAHEIPLGTNAEIVTVTDVAGDLFTVMRAQETTTARAIVLGDQIYAAITAQALGDLLAPLARTDAPNLFTDEQTITDAGANTGRLRLGTDNTAFLQYNGTILEVSGTIAPGSGLADLGTPEQWFASAYVETLVVRESTARTGVINLRYGDSIVARNAADDGDLRLLAVDEVGGRADTVLVGGVDVLGKIAALEATPPGALPTAPIGQALISQGAGVAPIFSADLVINSLNANGAMFSRYSVVCPEGQFVGTGLRLVGFTVGQIGAGEAIGDMAHLSDSTTKTPGDVITGGGTFHVLAWWNGTAWIAIGG